MIIGKSNKTATKGSETGKSVDTETTMERTDAKQSEAATKAKSKVTSNKLVIYNTLSTIILYAITFFSAPLFSRLLGKTEYGVVQVYNTWVAFFTVIVGLYTRGTLSIAKVNFDDNTFRKYQSSILFLSLIGFCGIFAVVMIFNPLFTSFFELGIGYLIIMLIHSFGTYCIYFINTKFTYEMKARNNLMISVTLALINFGFSYLLIKFLPVEHLYTARILGMAIPYTVAGIIICIYIFRQGRTLYNKEYWKFCLPLCLPLIFHGISGIICSSSDRVMIQKMIGLSAVGIYALAYNFSNVMDSIWSALHNSWDPFFFEYVKHSQFTTLKERSKNYIRLYTCLSMGFILLTPEVYHLFADRQYWEGAIIIPVVVLSAYSIFVYAFAANYEFCFKRTDMVAIGSAISGGANIVLNYFFITWMGYFGAAVATLLSNILLAFVHIKFAKKIVKDKWVYNVRMFVMPVIGLCVATWLYYTCFDLWLIRWAVAACVGIFMLNGIYKDKAIF